MNKTMQDKRKIFIESIMEENAVSRASVDKSKKENKDEINNMNQIFDFDNETSKLKCAALLSLISRDKEKENIKYYTKFENLKMEAVQSYKEKYKTVIIASLEANNRFFVNACNLYSFIQSDVRKIKEKDKKTRLSKNKRNSAISRLPTRPPKKESMETVIVIWVYRPPQNKSIITYTSGDTAGYAPMTFNKHHIDDIKGKYYGDVICSGNSKSGLLELSFQFMDKKTKKPVKKIPFYLNVKIFLYSDKSKHTIKLDQTINSSTICSKPKKLDFFTKEISICEVKEVI